MCRTNCVLIPKKSFILVEFWGCSNCLRKLDRDITEKGIGKRLNKFSGNPVRGAKRENHCMDDIHIKIISFKKIYFTEKVHISEFITLISGDAS